MQADRVLVAACCNAALWGTPHIIRLLIHSKACFQLFTIAIAYPFTRALLEQLQSNDESESWMVWRMTDIPLTKNDMNESSSKKFEWILLVERNKIFPFMTFGSDINELFNVLTRFSLQIWYYDISQWLIQSDWIYILMCLVDCIIRMCAQCSVFNGECAGSNIYCVVVKLLALSNAIHASCHSGCAPTTTSKDCLDDSWCRQCP